MTLKEYKCLDELEQILLFWKACPIGTFQVADYVYECRQLDSFYIELRTDGTSFAEISCHMDTNLLDPYLDKSDLSHILQ